MRFNRESIDRAFDYKIHLESRTIFLMDSLEGGIDHVSAERFITALHLLSKQNPEAPIHVVLNSFGGCFYSGMAIYDSIKACPCHVTIEVVGSAFSMGSIVLQAADERIIHPNAFIMIHDGHEEASLTPKSFESQAEQSKITRKMMYQIYAERSGKDTKFWEKKCALDTYISAEHAKELGLVDKIVGEEEDG
jgi:ATP-dependent Clp protease protease subunit